MSTTPATDVAPATAYKPHFEIDAAHTHQELGKHILADGYDLVLDLKKSSGSYMVDAAKQKRYLDFFTCFASMPIGMNHPKMVEEDFVRYLGTVAINKPSNSDIYSTEMAAFVKTFHDLALPGYFRYSFFIEGGALAVENALKVAFDWKVRKNFRKGYSYEKGHKIMHFRQAFHGRSGYTMSLTNTDPNKVKYFPKFNDWPRISNPFIIYPLNEENTARVEELERQAVREMEQAFIDHRDDIAAIIIEPIQGEGGDNHFRPEFMRELRRLADENEALLIFDEVQTGLGITGSWWAHQQLGVHPDIMAFGKKMQVCGIAVTNRIDDIDDNVFHVSSRINSTWGGNLVDMVRATKYIEIIHEEGLVDNARVVGEYLVNQLHKLSEIHPDLVFNPRGRGLYSAFSLRDTELRGRVIDNCYENGLLILSSGSTSVRFRPPLNLTKDQVDEGISILDTSIRQALSHHRV